MGPSPHCYPPVSVLGVPFWALTVLPSSHPCQDPVHCTSPPDERGAPFMAQLLWLPLHPFVSPSPPCRVPLSLHGYCGLPHTPLCPHPAPFWSSINPPLVPVPPSEPPFSPGVPPPLPCGAAGPRRAARMRRQSHNPPMGPWSPATVTSVGRRDLRATRSCSEAAQRTPKGDNNFVGDSDLRPQAPGLLSNERERGEGLWGQWPCPQRRGDIPIPGCMWGGAAGSVSCPCRDGRGAARGVWGGEWVPRVLVALRGSLSPAVGCRGEGVLGDGRWG